MKKLNAEHSIMLSEYDNAVNRNFKRVERFEDKLSGEKQAGICITMTTLSSIARYVMLGIYGKMAV